MSTQQIVNNFNVSQLKKRVMMMNKQKTAKGKASKYLLAIPIILALLLGNAVQALPTDLMGMPGENETIAKEHQAPQKKRTRNRVSKQEIVKTADGEAYNMCEQMPEFPGGEKALMAYIEKNMKYPESAVENNKDGRVIVRFMVSKTGQVSDATIVRGIDPDCDQEAIRVINGMPTWNPGKQDGKTVDVYYTIPIVFKLTKSTDAKHATRIRGHEDVLFVVNGKILTDTEFKEMKNRSKITSVNILSTDSIAVQKYGDIAKGKKVMEVTISETDTEPAP
jgi:TonB family protein